jgi:hypothetical protein
LVSAQRFHILPAEKDDAPDLASGQDAAPPPSVDRAGRNTAHVSSYVGRAHHGCHRPVLTQRMTVSSHPSIMTMPLHRPTCVALLLQQKHLRRDFGLIGPA